MTDAVTPAYKTLEDAIGGTPLVRLQRLPGAASAAPRQRRSWASSRATTRPAR